MSGPRSEIESLSLLGAFLEQFPLREKGNMPGLESINNLFHERFLEVLEREPVLNPWFTREFLDMALRGIASMLQKEVLEKWCSSYPELAVEQGKEFTVGLVLAGNIPLVGFHDILSVLISGHRIKAKPSSKDDRLIGLIAEIMLEIDEKLGSRLELSEENLRGIDAIIATGSNNSARYFEYYFREIPRIIRKNRNGVAILSGKESNEELRALGEDIFSYFGLGCRNVTKIHLPADYDLIQFMGAMDEFDRHGQHHKYANNVDYYRSIYLLNRIPFLDNGVLLLKEDPAIASPVGVVFYERYSEIGSLLSDLESQNDAIQCIVSLDREIPGAIEPGSTQKPMPWDYADGVDTLRFLAELK